MAKYNTKELLLIWLDSFSELSYGEKVSLFDELKNETSIKSKINSIKTVSPRLKEKLIALSGVADNSYLSGIIKRMDDFGITAITKESELYPEELKTIETPPSVLYCKGNLELLSGKKFAVVGSRKSLPISIELTEKYVKAIVDCGFTPVTGIADGVDGKVLKTAIEINCGAISVFAGGLDMVYPTSNVSLAESVSKSGLIVSEYPLGVPTKKYSFPLRNRIIAGMSEGVLIVSGGEKSGTVSTGNYAMEYGKDVFAIPYNVGIQSGKAPNGFIKKGAFLTDEPDDIYDFYGISKKAENVVLSEDETLIIRLIGDGNEHIERIAEKLNKSAYEIMPILSLLEIKGQIIQSGANKYSLIKTIPEE